MNDETAAANTETEAVNDEIAAMYDEAGDTHFPTNKNAPCPQPRWRADRGRFHYA